MRAYHVDREWIDARRVCAYCAAVAVVESSGYAHIRLTVTDIARSKAFYDEVFGWPVADVSDRVHEPGVAAL